MQIHWHEGLFLLPHHMQRLQRMALESVRTDRTLAWAYPYGVIESRVSRDDLENMRLRFDRLRAIMPSGLEVDFPNEAELPSLDIKEALDQSGSLTVYLAVPIWFSQRANCVLPGSQTDARAKILYRVTESEWADENSGGNQKPILERRINARLLFEHEDRSDLESIPLLRIVRSTGETVGLPRQDPGFVGPCLVLNGSASLRELVRDLNGQVQACRQELLLQVNRGGFSLDTMRGIQFEQIMRLRSLNRSAARLESLLEVPHVPPFEYYLEMRDLLGELSAMHPEKDLYESLPYQHDNPWACFNEIASKIRLFLRGSVAPNFVKVPFEDRQGVLQATLTDEHFARASDYFLGIQTREDPLTLARFVENEDSFKLMPASLANRAIRGVLLKEERFPPLELPAQSGLYYFRLLRGECVEIWNQVRSEKSAVVRWTGNDAADYQVTLYMTLPRE